MTDILSQVHTVRSEQVDVNRRMRPSALLMQLQEIALDHSALLGLGNDATLHRNLLWVVTRYHAEISHMPRYEETITLETWPGPMRRILFPRYFRMKDAAGNVLLRASSLWVLIDGEQRRMISPKQYGLNLNDGLVVGDELPYNVPVEPIATQRTASFTVPYSYLDLNGHMNNTRYFDLCLDLIPEEAMHQELSAISAEYQNEVRFGETISVAIGRNDNTYAFTGETAHPCFRIGLSFAQEENA